MSEPEEHPTTFSAWARSYGALCAIGVTVLIASLTTAQSAGRNEQRITAMEVAVREKGGDVSRLEREVHQARMELAAMRGDVGRVRADVEWIRRRLEGRR